MLFDMLACNTGFFAADAGATVDLHALAAQWIDRAQQRSAS